MATLFAVVTAYSVLFGLLSWLQLRSVWAFVAIVVYFTAIAAAQWSMFGGRHPYWASSVISGMLTAATIATFGIAAAFAKLPFSPLDVLEGTPVAFIIAVFLAFGVGAVVDITLLVIEISGGIDRKLLFPRTDAHATASRISPRVLAAGFALLAIVFVFALFMIVMRSEIW